MNKWIAEFDLEEGDTMPEHMDLNYMGAHIDFHCRPMWIPVSERLPEVDEEGESNGVFIALKETIYHMYKCQRVHITKIAFYDKNAISSDGLYMNTEGWVLNDGRTLSMNEVIAWQELPELPEPYKESEDK